MKERYFLQILDHDLHGPDGERIAAALCPEEASGMGAVPEQELTAPVILAGECTSTFDAAWLLARTEDFPPWSAVIAQSQTQGRGQLRREWISPPGNLYVSFFLPYEFDEMGDMAALVTGYCLHTALGIMNIATRLKWPNDLLLELPGGKEGKFGGLLLEEREGRLLAGLGLNLRSAPDDSVLREGRAVPAAALSPRNGNTFGLWQNLARNLDDVFSRDIVRSTRDTIREKVENTLAWRGRQVRTDESGVTGELVGLDSSGALLLRTGSGIVAVSSGSVAPA